MDEEEQDEGGNEEVRLLVGEVVGKWSNPENGSTGVTILLPEIGKELLVRVFTDIFECIVTNIKAKHLPSVKWLVELANLVNSGRDVPAATYESLAEILTKSWKEEQEKQGTGNRE